MSFKDELLNFTKEELIEELINMASNYLDEYDCKLGPGEILEASEYKKLIREKLECPICGRLDGNNHDDLAHQVNSDYVGT